VLISNKNFARAIIALVLLTAALPVLTTAAVSSRACFLSSGEWVNFPLSRVETHSFRISYDATPLSSEVDAVTGLSSGPASEYTDLAAIIRFNLKGAIDARNGSTYSAISVIPYLAGATYHFIMDINISTHTYNAYVMLGSVRAPIGVNLAFRTEQASITSLNNLGVMTTRGSHSICQVAASSGSAPAITSQPASVSIRAGQNASFFVASTGTAPINYQWNKNGLPISGATSSTYTTSLTAADDDAKFNVVVSNNAGSTTSNTATVTVTTVPLPAGCLSSSGTWINASLGQTQSGGFRTSFDATPSTANMDGVTGLSSEVASAYQSLAAAVRFNTSGNIDARNGARFTATQAIPYSAGLTYHFILDVNVPNHTYNAYVAIGSMQLTIGTHLAFRTQQAHATSLRYLGALTATGKHTVCNLGVSTAADSVPVITSQPASITVPVGRTANFSVSAYGIGLTYRWTKNGALINGATSSSFAALASLSDNGTQFSVIVSNAAGSVSSMSATLTVPPASTLLLNSSASSLNFGNVGVSTSAVQKLAITNAGNASITISQVSIAGAGFNASGANGLILSPGQSTTLIITFAPAANGLATGSVTVSSNATNSPATIALSGTGVAATAHSVILSWTASDSGVVGYQVYSSTVSGGPYVRMTSTPVNNSSYAVTGVQPGRTYYYVVTALNSSSQESAYSSEVTAIVP
jgi:Abnormal spindle-like microcephaly-assoc'd, ASPM-SPD-2-Hydin/Fibronectin type III domain